MHSKVHNTEYAVITVKHVTLQSKKSLQLNAKDPCTLKLAVLASCCRHCCLFLNVSFPSLDV